MNNEILNFQNNVQKIDRAPKPETKKGGMAVRRRDTRMQNVDLNAHVWVGVVHDFGIFQFPVVDLHFQPAARTRNRLTREMVVLNHEAFACAVDYSYILGYTGIRAHTGPSVSVPQKQLTVFFWFFGYTGFLIYRTPEQFSLHTRLQC